jgi:hypothetical protein
MKIFLYFGRELHCLVFCLGTVSPFGELIKKNFPFFMSSRSVYCNNELRTIKYKCSTVYTLIWQQVSTQYGHPKAGNIKFIKDTVHS